MNLDTPVLDTPIVDSAALDTSLGDIMQMGWGQITLGKVLYALVLLAVCLAVSQMIVTLLRKLLEKRSKDGRISRFILRIIRAVLYIVTGLIVAGSLGVDVTSIIALVSVFGLAVSLAVQDVLSNVASSIVMIFAKPFSIGDYISTDDGEGTVEEVSLVHTKLRTYDGLLVMLPNSKLAAGKIINYTSLGQRRVVHTISASYDDSPDAVYAACRKAIRRTPFVLEDPAPAVALSKYGESSIEYQVRLWVPAEHYWDAYFACLDQIGRCFAEDGVTMTYNHLNVHIIEEDK